MSTNEAQTSKVLTLSECINVDAEELDRRGILNALVGIDTKLFIDPKLINITEIPELEDVTEDIHEYVRRLIRVNSQAHKADRIMEIAIGMIAIHEPVGLSIGYGNSRDTGTSIPRTVALNSLRSLNEMIDVGVESLEVMELLGLFISRFGSDSISDLIAHIIYPRLCLYTQRVAEGLKVQNTKIFRIGNTEYSLPVNPINGKQLIFVPLDILSELPLATDWSEIAAAAQKNADCRAAFNAIVGEDIAAYAKKVKKDPSVATSSASTLRTIVEVYDDAIVKPYDKSRDPAGYLRINNQAATLGERFTSPEASIRTVDEMIEFINEEVITQFKRDVEKLGANTFLFARKGGTSKSVDYTKPVHEDATQILFHTAADHVCRKTNILVNRESTVANGAVDFSIGQGYSNKVLVEIKKSNNKNLLDGYDHQLAEYIERENAAAAFYVVLIVTDSSVSNKDSQLNLLKQRYAEKINKGERCPELVVINALEQISPSKLKSA